MNPYTSIVGNKYNTQKGAFPNYFSSSLSQTKDSESPGSPKYQKKNITNIVNQSNIKINSMDFFFLDQFKNIKKFKVLDKVVFSNNIFLFYENNGSISQQMYNINDFNGDYFFIKIQYEKDSIGLLLPKKKANMFNMKKIITHEIQNSPLLNEMSRSLKIKNLSQNNFELEEVDDNFPRNNNDIFKIKFNIRIKTSNNNMPFNGESFRSSIKNNINNNPLDDKNSIFNINNNNSKPIGINYNNDNLNNNNNTNNMNNQQNNNNPNNNFQNGYNNTNNYNNINNYNNVNNYNNTNNYNNNANNNYNNNANNNYNNNVNNNYNNFNNNYNNINNYNNNNGYNNNNNNVNNNYNNNYNNYNNINNDNNNNNNGNNNNLINNNYGNNNNANYNNNNSNYTPNGNNTYIQNSNTNNNLGQNNSFNQYQYYNQINNYNQNTQNSSQIQNTSISSSSSTSSRYYFSEKGLYNIGSTCYMNATLQCLLHINELIEYFLNSYQKEALFLIKANKDVETKGNISKAFYELVKGVQSDDDNNNMSQISNFNTKTIITKSKNFMNNFFNFSKKKAFSPDNFKKVLGYYNPQFRKFEANDSKDLILYLLQTMHEELNYYGSNSLPSNLRSPNQLNRYETFLYFNNTYNNRNFSIISTIFYGTYENVTKCLKCNNNIYNFQKFEFISFGMCDYHRKKFNIYEGFADNEKEQLLTGDNQFYCNVCRELCDAKISCKIIQPPNKLLINIDYGKNKRFQPSKIEFDEIINITKYVNFDFGYELKYRIVGVCTHLGYSGNYGHYIAYCRHRLTGQWYEYNDSSSHECKASEIYGGSPYLLLYEKID